MLQIARLLTYAEGISAYELFGRSVPVGVLRIFLSHERNDAYWSQSLAQALRARQFMVWYDNDVPGGTSFVDDIQFAIADCDVFLVVVTPASVKSDWVNREVNHAINTSRFMIKLILSETPPLRFMSLDGFLSEVAPIDVRYLTIEQVVDKVMVAITNHLLNSYLPPPETRQPRYPRPSTGDIRDYGPQYSPDWRAREGIGRYTPRDEVQVEIEIADEDTDETDDDSTLDEVDDDHHISDVADVPETLSRPSISKDRSRNPQDTTPRRSSSPNSEPAPETNTHGASPTGSDNLRTEQIQSETQLTDSEHHTLPRLGQDEQIPSSSQSGQDVAHPPTEPISHEPTLRSLREAFDQDIRNPYLLDKHADERDQ